MEFELNETQQLVRDNLRDYVDRSLMAAGAELDLSGEFPHAQLKELADMGMLGVNVPEHAGGAGAGVVAYSLAMQEVARGCASTAVTMAVTNMVAEVIAHFGSEAQVRRYVPALCEGKLGPGSFALSESEAGSDPGAMRTRAVREGDGWILDGAKQWITSGSEAGVMVVWARTGGEGNRGLSCFLVEGGTPGLSVISREDKLGLRASSTVSLAFEGCRVPADALLGELGGGFKVAMLALDGGRIGIASQALGIATSAMERSAAYARERRQFGTPIASFQAIQWMLADSATELEAARLLTFRAALRKERGEAFSSQAAMAKLYASEAAFRVCDRAVQIHGGNGYVREYQVERHLRDVRVTRIYEGTSEVQRVVIGRSVLAST